MSEKGDSSIESPEALAGAAGNSSSVYAFLAAVFREAPSAPLLRNIRSAGLREALAEAGLDSDVLAGPEDDLVEELAAEYTGLFCGPGGHVAPYESVHAGNVGGALWGPETAEVRRYIEAAGFSYRPEYHGLPDHISVELDFMSATAAQESAAWRTGDVAAAANCLAFEREFLNDHLGKWAPGFCGAVAERAGHRFYRSIAHLTAEFLASESDELRRRSRMAAGAEDAA